MRRNRTRTNGPSAVLWISYGIVGVCLIGLISSVQSGPVYERTRRMLSNGDEASVISSSNNGMARNETSPNKDVCVTDGHTVPRRLVFCPPKPGCRAIQKEGECCPEYQCECERNGKLYENGEKIMDPEKPCRVCYCQGGEFTCNNVTCYERNDCTARYTPGRCCPEYDNCPPLENRKPDHSENNSSDNTDEDTDRTTSAPSTSSAATTQSSTSNSAVSNDNPLGIKIKEITKPEEIRITDEKPKFKVATTTTTTTISTTTSTTTPQPSSSSSSSSSPETTSDADYSTGSAVTKSTEDSQGHFNQTDDPFELDEEFAHDYFNETDTNKNVREANDAGEIPEESEEEAEEKENTSEDDKRPSSTTPETILSMDGRLDDDRKDIKQVIIVDHNGASKPITIIGSSSLQFGGSNPDEDFNPYELPLPNHQSSSTPHVPIDDYPTEELGSGHSSPSAATTTTESDLLAQGSTKREVYVPIMEGSAMPAEDEPTIDFEKYNFTETTYPLYNSSEVNSEEEDRDTYSFNSTTWQPEDSPKVSPSDTTVADRTPFQNDELTNPEYPNIPEDLTIHGEQEHPEDQMFIHSSPATPLSDHYVDAQKRSPGEPHLIPEWERTNGTEEMANFEEENMEEESHGKGDSSEETNLVDGGNGKSSEPTTTSSFRFDIGDINLEDDMMEENSTEEKRNSPSPKDDVESLKMRHETESNSERMSLTTTTETERRVDVDELFW